MSMIKIQKPCNENWDTMIVTPEGKYCDSCNKIVIDFTSMTDNQIIEYLDQNKTKRTCGYLNTSQTDNKQNTFHRILLDAYQNIGRKYSLKPVKNSLLFLLGFVMIIAGCQKRTKGEVNLEKTPADSNCNKSESKMDSSRGKVLLGEMYNPGEDSIRTKGNKIDK